MTCARIRSSSPAGTFRQRTELTTAQRDILTKLDIDAPKKIIELGPATTS